MTAIKYRYKLVNLLREIKSNGYMADLHMRESLDWHLARMEGKIHRKSRIPRITEGACPFCGEISDFLRDNKYCECLMETYEKNYEKRHPLDGPFDQYEDRCIEFMIFSWASLAGNKIKREAKVKSRKAKTKLRKRKR